ncbi:MAG: rhodanese-like domain-containing protein [Roseovarius sp.]
MPALRHWIALPALTVSLMFGLSPLPGTAPGITLGITLGTVAHASEPMFQTTLDSAKLPKPKHTKAGLYLTAAEAAQVLATREDVLLIDVRTPEETVLVGYPAALDANIPIATFNPDHPLSPSGSYAMQPNKNFALQAKTYITQRNPAAVLVICRSGSRSARAVDILQASGVDLPLYSVVDGFEGDRNAQGLRVLNGWRNSGAPWTTKPRPDLLVRTP